MARRQLILENKKMRKKRYRVRASRLIIFVLIIVAFIAGIFFIVDKIGGGTAYDDEKSFQKFAEDQFKEIGGEQQIGEGKDIFEYGGKLSYAAQMPKTGYKDLDKKISASIAEERDEWFKENENLVEDEKAAIIAGFESYETPEQAVGFSVTMVKYQEIDGTRVSKYQTNTYNVSKKMGMPLGPVQIFKGDYASIFQEEAEYYLEDNYGDSLKSDYKETIAKNKDHFVMTNEGFKYYFNSGTVVPVSEGAISFVIPYEKFKKVMRDDIGKRVIDPSKPMVAITYDDGPSATTTAKLLDVYEKNEAVCTFFELGSCVDEVEGSGDLLKRELELGCEVGTHSYAHSNLPTLSDEQLKDDAAKSAAAFKNAAGIEPTIMRCPYGEGNDKIAEVFGLPTINWTVDTLDWSSRNADAVIKVVQSSGDLNGDIILMHSIYQSSVDASEVLVPWLQDQGYQLVTVSELLKYKYGYDPIPVKNLGYTFQN